MSYRDRKAQARRVSSGWGESRVLPHEDFPGLGWDFTVLLGRGEDPYNVRVSLERRDR